MTAIQQQYIYNNTYHSKIKVKPADVKSSTYIDSSKEVNNKDGS